MPQDIPRVTSAPQKKSKPSRPRRSTSRPSASSQPVGVLAPKPKPTGVFVDARPRRQTVSTRAETRSKVRKAEERLPGTTAPVKRYPDLKEPTRKQAQTIVRGTREALKGMSVQERLRALESGDRTTRRQLGIASRANQRLERDDRVRTGLAIVRARPEAFGLTGQAAVEVRKPVKGRLPSPVRGALAHIGAEAARSHVPVRLKPRAKSGTKKGVALLGAAAIDLSKLNVGAAAGKAASGAATVATSSISAAAKPVADALRSTGAGSDENALKNFGKDVVHFPYDAVNSAVEVGAAAVDLTKGDPDRAKKLIGSLDDGVLGALAAGDVELAVKRMGEHPLYGGLEFTGLGSAVGKVAGAAGRSGALGGRVQEALATERANLRASRHGGVEEQRSYSRNAVVNLAQKAADELKRRRGLDPDVAGSTGKSERMLRRATNEEVAAAEDLRREAKTSTEREALEAVRGGRRRPAVSVEERSLRDLVGQAAEGRLGAQVELRDNVRAERQRLEGVWAAEHRSMDLGGRTVLRKQIGALKHFGEVLSGKHGPEATAALFERAGAVREIANRQTGRAVDLNMLTEGQADAARLRSFATVRLGARYDGSKAPTDAGVAAREAGVQAQRAARRLVVVADRGVRTAERRLGAARARGSAPAIAKAERAVKDAVAARSAARKQAADVRVPSPRQFRTGLVVEDGRGGTRKLALPEIRAAWEREHPGEPLPAFISHQGRGAAGSRFVNFSGMRGPQRTTVDAHRRTGEAARRGTGDVTERGVVDSLVHTAGAISAVENFDRIMARFGSKRHDGELFTPEEAELEIRARTEGLNARTPEVEWGAYSVAPQRYGAERIAEIGQSIDAAPGSSPSGLVPDALRALKGDEDPGRRNVILLPKAVAETIMKHQSPTTSDLARGAQAFTNVFRGTVLPTSTKWLFGNAAEMALRLALQHGPMAIADVAHGRRLMKALEEADSPIAAQLRVMTQGGQHFGSATRLSVYRDASMFKDPVTKQIAQIAHGIRQGELQGMTSRDLRALGRVGPKAVFDGYKMFSDRVIQLNKALEQQGQAAVVGKLARREAQEMTRSWAKSLLLQGKTFDALVNSDRVNSVEWAAKAAREIDKTLGKYSRFSPQMRRLVQTMAPFLPWYLNAARFVYWTLPKENPVKAALLARVEATFDEEMQQQADALPPGDLGANPRRGDGGIVPVSRYTPFGAFTSFGRDYESVLQESVSPILPQFSTPFTIAVFGENFAHRALKKQDGSDVSQGDRAAMAAYSLFESAVPFMQIARRMQEHGETGFDDSTVFAPRTKPGTASGRSAADRIFNPVSPTYLAARSGTTSSRPPVASGPRDPLEDALDAALADDGPAPADQALEDALDAALATP